MVPPPPVPDGLGLPQAGRRWEEVVGGWESRELLSAQSVSAFRWAFSGPAGWDRRVVELNSKVYYSVIDNDDDGQLVG